MNILNKKPKDHENFLKAYELFANHYDDLEAIKKIDRKTLVMTGSEDVGSTPTMSKELVKDLVNSTYIEIKNGKHLCSIECADDVNMKIRNFINHHLLSFAYLLIIKSNISFVFLLTLFKFVIIAVSKQLFAGSFSSINCL